ncbi:MAG: transketolase, partial [Lachnospiraceae bacterium]|nr:transketolase [Lachnospiraceae bacterium]
RMQAFGFKTLTVEDGNDIEAISQAIETAKEDCSAPYFITIKTQIGYGVPKKMGSASAHGEPLGEENIKEMRKFLNWEEEEPFLVPKEVYAHYDALVEEKKTSYSAWEELRAKYENAYPECYAKYCAYHNPGSAAALLQEEKLWTAVEKPEAPRASSGEVIQILKDLVPNLFGGSADLAPSTKTEMKGEGFYSPENPLGKNIHFGVRELAMAGIANGILLHGGLRSYVATFFVFSDYVKPMARLAALMGLPQIYVLTHDSIGVGEDGPTHEPIEQLAMLRSTPNFRVFRPCDRQETAAAWFSALSSTDCPTAIVLSRQNLPQYCKDGRDALKGAYILSGGEEEPELILMATGSEVELAEEAAKVLRGEGRAVRVVSMPSLEVFALQSPEYQEKVLPKSCRKRISIEALSTFGWGKYVGFEGKSIGLD